MSDSYQVLKGKYQMAIVSIRELEQEREDLKNQMKELSRDRAQMEKNTKYLCETILKKDREKKDEEAWFKLPLPRMIAEAQASLENYFPSMEKLYRNFIKRLQQINEERTEKIAQMQAQMDEMEKEHQKEIAKQAAYKDDAIKRLEKILKTGIGEDEEAAQIVAAAIGEKGSMQSLDMEPGDTDDISFREEDGDGLASAVANSMPAFVSVGQTVVQAKNSPTVKPSAKTEQAVKTTVKKIADTNAKEAARVAALLTNQQKMLIRIMGDSGCSGMPDIITAGEAVFPDIPIRSRFNTGMQTLTKPDKWTNGEWPGFIIERYPCPVPGSSNFVVYKLSQMGRDIYKYLFKKDAAEPEMDIIKKHHTSIEHGYGIKKTAEMIQESTYAKQTDARVVYMTRTKEYTIKVGEKNAYIPDIVIISKGKNGKEYREYIEYETGDCKEKDLIAKCNKMAEITRFLNFVVPEQKVKDQLIKELEAWKTAVLESGNHFKWDRPVEGRVLAYSELKAQSNVSRFQQIDWTRVIVSKPRKKEG